MGFLKFIAVLLLGKPSGNQRRAPTKIRNTCPLPEDSYYQATGPVIKRHYAMIDKIEAAWKAKDRPKIISLCEDQIAIAAEVLYLLREEERINSESQNDYKHTGFYRLAMLHEREGNFNEAIATCELGISIGWSIHDLSARAARCRKRLSGLGG